MNTTKNKTYTQETYNIPCDVMPEIAQIILQGRLSHEIINVEENKREIVIGISYQNELDSQKEAIKNITDVLDQYHDLRFGENEINDWRED